MYTAFSKKLTSTNLWLCTVVPCLRLYTCCMCACVRACVCVHVCLLETLLLASYTKIYEKKRWCDVTVGDLVEVTGDGIFPADLLLVDSCDRTTNLCYVETSNLDGETNLKQRSVPKGLVLPEVWSYAWQSALLSSLLFPPPVLLRSQENEFYWD